MADDQKPFHNPFGALAALKASMPATPEATPGLKPRGSTDSPQESSVEPQQSVQPIQSVEPQQSSAEPGQSALEPRTFRSGVLPKGPARAVVRMERAGRGGKEVTVVEHLGLRPSELEKWLKDLKAGLGCGGVVEGETLVLQGNHRERLVKLLAARGVKKVTIGS